MAIFTRMKDLFSDQSDRYAQYRPQYPQALADWLAEHSHAQTAWDCGAGNGQFTRLLAKVIPHIEATDISGNQLQHAYPDSRIRYTVQPAEETTFADQSFDLITVAQAVHWFQFERFYAEVTRVAKPGAIVALIGYGEHRIHPEADAIVRELHREVLGSYWDAERAYVDAAYQTVPFPFQEIETPLFKMVMRWTPEELFGYIGTWSALKKFVKVNGYNPLNERKPALLACLASVNEVEFPLFMRVGRVIK